MKTYTQELYISSNMEGHFVWIKAFLFVILDAAIMQDMVTINELLRFIFYGIGIFVMATSAYDWNKGRINYNKWKKGGFKPEEKEMYGIK